MRNNRSNLSGALVSLLLCGGAAQATMIQYNVVLSGAAEEPANASAGTGSGTISYDNASHTLRVQVTFSGLTGNTTASHIHAATATPGAGNAGVATQVPTFANFPLGVTSGSYDHTFDLTALSSFNSAYVTANGGTATSAEAALATAMSGGRAYLNIHSSAFGSGEIRGFLTPVPDSAGSASLFLIALAGLLATARWIGPR